jgi:hypothetical protein
LQEILGGEILVILIDSSGAEIFALQFSYIQFLSSRLHFVRYIFGILYFLLFGSFTHFRCSLLSSLWFFSFLIFIFTIYSLLIVYLYFLFILVLHFVVLSIT